MPYLCKKKMVILLKSLGAVDRPNGRATAGYPLPSSGRPENYGPLACSVCAGMHALDQMRWPTFPFLGSER